VSFDGHDLRVGTDVFDADCVYVGCVVRIRWDRSATVGSSIGSVATVAPPFSGERLGPMPTAALGNDGPLSQSPATRYASRWSSVVAPERGRPIELLVFRWLVSLNWATARPRLRRIPTDLIQVVALERINLSVREDELS
jgi:hypothetical protein